MTEHLITTTMQPGRVVQVDDQELEDLTRMGVVAGLVPSSLEQVPAAIQIPPAAAMQAGGAAVGKEVESSGRSEEGGGEEAGA